MADPDRDFSNTVHYVARTDIGMRRANNQDAFCVALSESDTGWQERGHLFVVADGMGAHAAGELASKLAADGISHLYEHYRELAPHEALERAIVETNTNINRRGKANPDFHAMGTTASTLVLLPHGAIVGHVGDSRVYRLRGTQLEQLTFDHSLLWELRALGRLEEGSDLARNVPKNVITRSLGPNAEVTVDLEGPFPLEVGDTFLLCSDGLTGQVEDAEIGQLLSSLPLDEAGDTLIDLANLRGGPDNVTLLIVRVVDSPQPSDDSPERSEGPGGTRRSKRASSANSAAWVVAGVCAFLALVLWFAEQKAPSVVALIGGGLAAVYGLILRFRGRESVAQDASVSTLGHGPHTHASCPPTREFTQSLASILDQLREAAVERRWAVNWKEYDRIRVSADQAAQVKSYPQAIRHYSAAIRFMVKTVARQSNREQSSAVDF